MARVTVDLDDGVLAELERYRRGDARPLGDVISELVGRALADAIADALADAARDRTTTATSSSGFHWHTADMRARVDIEDPDAVVAAFGDSGSGEP